MDLSKTIIMTTKNKMYYLISLTRRLNRQQNIDVFEAIYCNGLIEITRTWRHGETIPTIIYDNE